jgi:hypothetical protein
MISEERNSEKPKVKKRDKNEDPRGIWNPCHTQQYTLKHTQMSSQINVDHIPDVCLP